VQGLKRARAVVCGLGSGLEEWQRGVAIGTACVGVRSSAAGLAVPPQWHW
jgi:hypothetical protein